MRQPDARSMIETMSPRQMASVETASAFGVVLVMFLVCVVVESIEPKLRYAKYLLPAFALAITAPLHLPQRVTSFARRDLPDFLSIATIVVALSLAVVMYRDAPTSQALTEAYFVITPLITAYLIFPFLRPERIQTYSDWLLFAMTAAYLANRGNTIGDALAHSDGFWSRLLTSSSATESGASFSFGLLALYFVCTGRRTRALWAIALMVLSFKRIAMLGTLFCILGWGLLRLSRVDLRRSWRLVALLAILANGLVLVTLHQLSTGHWDEVIERYTGVTGNWATMGRQSLYGTLFSSFELTFTGNGLGTITAHLQSIDSVTKAAHSDVLKYVLEVGPLLAAAWAWALYRLARGSTAALLLVLFTNIMFVSDNVSIYFGYLFLLYLLIGFLCVREEQQRCEAPARSSREDECAPSSRPHT